MSLVLKVADPKTITVPVTCQQYGDDDRVINTLKLKVTFEKTKSADWKRETEEADASLDEKGVHVMLRAKIKNIVGLPLERDGQPASFDEAAMDLVLEHPWIADQLWLALQSVNAGQKSDAYRRLLLKN
jgi:hypothetical protein